MQWEGPAALARTTVELRECGRLHSCPHVRYAAKAAHGECSRLAHCAPTGTSYRATRLLFKAEIIEPLEDNDVFSIVTPEGVFQMTKAEFRRVFPNVVESASYREHGVYHYPTAPEKALPYLVRR